MHMRVVELFVDDESFAARTLARKLTSGKLSISSFGGEARFFCVLIFFCLRHNCVQAVRNLPVIREEPASVPKKSLVKLEMVAEMRLAEVRASPNCSSKYQAGHSIFSVDSASRAFRDQMRYYRKNLP